MKHALPERRDPFKMLTDALNAGWQRVDTLPLAGEGTFEVMTMSGLIRLARNRKTDRKTRKADSYGPARATVIALESGNYLAAIAWRWPQP